MNNTNPDMQSHNIRVVRQRDSRHAVRRHLCHRRRATWSQDNRLLNLNTAHCNEGAARFGCYYAPGEPDMLRSGIYLGRGAERPAPARGNVIEDNEITGFKMAERCIAKRRASPRKRIRSAIMPAATGSFHPAIIGAMRPLCRALLCASALAGSPCFNGKNLDGWEVRGDGIWSPARQQATLSDSGRCRARISRSGSTSRPRLYTNAEYEEFDLSLDYFISIGGNSGVSIRDTSRAGYAFLPDWDPQRTPSHIGYEIQILDGTSDKFPAGSIYLFTAAAPRHHKPHGWNRLEIESRREAIRVKLNGAGEEGANRLTIARSVSWAMFRNIFEPGDAPLPRAAA